MRVVLDTSVLISAFRSSAGASFRLLTLARDRKLTLLATPALFLEYEDVLYRSEQMEVHGFTASELAMLMHDLTLLIEPLNVYFQWRPQLQDANDELVFEAAMNGRADAIVTHNWRDFASVQSKFAMRVLRPSEALREIER